ncbi:MAG: DNA-directed RNA polymerase subunit beta [Candidatus Lloydbacteria bacterium RIFCSPLOWO2_12_FULL_51_9]|uniref:DNA-directed RNA polymerase subunit beta n=1 Tax=Candidatus Lloydbacteria bacterium RIFCSPLOWO2_12_FULL_51_9 TaxID=1798669 RepID=A0A1G2DW34_9BACT|nr:MAG: DNA-directed RNA polymerase subunit beta [Candidatus Lloydbacteria bacterium RIFCSPLOWO2_12_FULL_51_9]
MQKKYFSRYKKPFIELPNLVETQVTSYKWLLAEEGLKTLFDEISPIEDYSGKKFELSFKNFEIGESKIDEFYAKDHRLTYEAPFRVTAKLKNKILHTEKEQEIFLADLPLQTLHGTFIINGHERVIVSQLTRSFGVSFTEEMLKEKKCFGAKIIPSRGAWIEIESEGDGSVTVHIDKKRKFPVSSLLRIFGHGKSDKEILSLFSGNPHAEASLKLSFEKDTAQTTEESYVDVYRRLRDGTLATAENAKEFIDSLFTAEKYDLSVVGRYRFNKLFKKNSELRTLSLEDIADVVSHVIMLNNTPDASADDIDHLGIRRVRFVGEMLQQRLRVGMTRMKRNIQNKMSTVSTDTTLPVQLLNPRPLQTSIKEFLNTNSLSQHMNQKNILDELEQLRTLSALGPGGLTRERAGFEVRDVHPSHYGRVCPIQTPEGQNIGLILRLSLYAIVNEFGIIETPYARVKEGKVTKEVKYLNALEEEGYNIAHAATPYDSDSGEISKDFVEARAKDKAGEVRLVSKHEVDFIDVAANQPFSAATSLIPFLEHDDANRALMGSNMQKQAVPCLVPDAPLVATGIERTVGVDSGRLMVSTEEGEVVRADARQIAVKNSKGKIKEYHLANFSRTNDFTVFHQRPVVSLGDKVKKKTVLADTSSTVDGELALGQNVAVAFLSWGGANYEDAIIISDRLVRDKVFTSIHIEEFEVNVRDTKLGPEVTTPDIPNVGEMKLKDLDEEGIVRVGAEVGQNDILVGKITPKGESELPPEERLLRSIFGEKARDVKDTSRRMEHGKKGRVIGVRVFSREKGDNLEPGIIKRVHIEVAELRNISVGDKLAGRHGNKGVISKILPAEDMPYLPNGTPVDVVLTPLGVPSRMNLGQILELHLGLAARTLDYQAISPSFLGATVAEIRDELEKAGYNRNGKMKLFDGRTGEAFTQDVAVGFMYIMKLHHMVEDKIHMRSIGPYSLIHQQPLGGKAQGGGQRFGEMEVWALEGYGAAHILREMMTVKSDDIMGRAAAFDSIIKGEDIKSPNTPESFKVLLNNLRSLALNVELIKESRQ